MLAIIGLGEELCWADGFLCSNSECMYRLSINYSPIYALTGGAQTIL